MFVKMANIFLCMSGTPKRPLRQWTTRWDWMWWPYQRTWIALSLPRSITSPPSLTRTPRMMTNQIPASPCRLLAKSLALQMARSTMARTPTFPPRPWTPWNCPTLALPPSPAQPLKVDRDQTDTKCCPLSTRRESIYRNSNTPSQGVEGSWSKAVTFCENNSFTLVVKTVIFVQGSNHVGLTIVIYHI